jgi:hypothetical protein
MKDESGIELQFSDIPNLKKENLTWIQILEESLTRREISRNAPSNLP